MNLNIDNIETYLINNILGILILSVVGSILGGILLICFIKAFRFFFPKLVDKIYNFYQRLLYFALKRSTKDQIKLYMNFNQTKLASYYSTLLAQLIFYFFVITWLLFTSYHSYTSGYIWITIITITSILFISWVSIKIFFTIASAWLVDMDIMAKKKIEDRLKNYKVEVKGLDEKDYTQKCFYKRWSNYC